VSIAKIVDVFKHSRQKGSDLLLLIALAEYANDDGEAYPSITTLAKRCRMSVRNCQYRIRQLIAAGELRIRENAGPRGVNVFVVQGAAHFTGGCSPLHQGGEVSRPGGVKLTASRTLREPSIEPRKTLSRSALEAAGLVKAFESLGVTQRMLERTFMMKFDHPLNEADYDELTELRDILKRISTKETTWADESPMDGYFLLKILQEASTSLEARGLLTELISIAWMQTPPCTLPDNDDAICALLRGPRSSDALHKHKAEVLSQWKRRIDGRLELPALSGQYYGEGFDAAPVRAEIRFHIAKSEFEQYKGGASPN
jgi:Helix-turn-helix domain